MTSPAISQKGVQFILGFNGNTYTGFQMDDATEKPTGELGYIADDNDCDASQMASDLGKQITLNGTILAETEAELGDLEDMELGDDITINSQACFVVDANLSFQRLQATGTIVAEVIAAITAAEAS
jgi:hypothetical protein